jgi:uncharacterized protein YdhG (YjbR/CyaY superfamily)
MKSVSRKDIWSQKLAPAKNVDDFIKLYPNSVQAKLKQMRQIIRSAAPKAEEAISYRMPTFKINGRAFVCFAGFRSHIGFYPMSGSFLKSFSKDLKDYVTTKGGVQFPLDKPLPVNLIKRMVKTRLNQVLNEK